jgi:hypothetical protein
MGGTLSRKFRKACRVISLMRAPTFNCFALLFKRARNPLSACSADCTIWPACVVCLATPCNNKGREVMASECFSGQANGFPKTLYIQYRYIIDWLLRKPGAFDNYRYRENLFPISYYRMAYDFLKNRSPEIGRVQRICSKSLSCRKRKRVRG